jgi:glycine dehydrogenase subunit 2
MAELLAKSRSEPEWMKGAPYTTPVRRLDDVKAARDLDLGYVPPKAAIADLNAGEPAHI